MERHRSREPENKTRTPPTINGTPKGSKRSRALARKAFTSALTSGRKFLDVADGRTRWYRRYRDLIQLHAADKGGLELLSHAELALLSNACTIQVELERRSARFAEGDRGATDDELIAYQQGANALRRLHETLGLKRDPERARLINGNGQHQSRERPLSHRILDELEAEEASR